MLLPTNDACINLRGVGRYPQTVSADRILVNASIPYPSLQPYGAVTEAVTETYSVARVSVDTSVTEPLRRPYGAVTEGSCSACMSRYL